MSLVSMCLQMMQRQASDLVRWVAEELGLIDDHLRPRLQYRRSRPGTVPVSDCSAVGGRDEVREEVVLVGQSPRSGRRRRRSTLCRQRTVQETAAGQHLADGGLASAQLEAHSQQQAEAAEHRQTDAIEAAQTERSDSTHLTISEESDLEEKEEDEEQEDEEVSEKLIEEEISLGGGAYEDPREHHRGKKKSELDRLIDDEIESKV